MLTAAHCAPSIHATVHIGVHDERLASPQISSIVEVISHPNFIPGPKYINDIALVRISPPVDLTSTETHAGLACVPPQTSGANYPEVDTRLAVIGWGTLASGSHRPTKLRQVRVKTLANDDRRCKSSIYDVDRQFCAMVDGGGKDSCQGLFTNMFLRWNPISLCVSSSKVIVVVPSINGSGTTGSRWASSVTVKVVRTLIIPVCTHVCHFTTIGFMRISTLPQVLQPQHFRQVFSIPPSLLAISLPCCSLYARVALSNKTETCIYLYVCVLRSEEHNER